MLLILESMSRVDLLLASFSSALLLSSGVPYFCLTGPPLEMELRICRNHSNFYTVDILYDTVYSNSLPSVPQHTIRTPLFFALRLNVNINAFFWIFFKNEIEI